MSFTKVAWLLAQLLICCSVSAQSTFTVIHQSGAVTGISRDGRYVVGVIGIKSSAPFIWSKATGVVSITPMNFEPYGGVSDTGIVAGQLLSQYGRNACYWSAASGIHMIGSLAPGASSISTAVSADGRVIFGFSGYSIFRWTSETGMVSLGTTPPGHYTTSYPTACTPDGKVAVGEFDSRPFKWTDMSGMEFPLSFSGRFNSVSDDGLWCVGRAFDPFFVDGVVVGPNKTFFVGSSSYPHFDSFMATNDLRCGIAEVESPSGDLTQFWRPDVGLVLLQDYLSHSGAASAASYKSIGGALITPSGHELAGTALDSDGAPVAFYATISVPQPGTVLSGLRVSPSPRVGSNAVSILAQLSDIAPQGGAAVELTTSSNLITPHSTALVGGQPGIFIAKGRTSGSDAADTKSVSTQQFPYVRATYEGISLMTQPQLEPAAIYDPTLSSSVVTGGSTVTGTVKLNGKPATSAVVSVSSSDTNAASVPVSVTVPTTSTSKTFTIQTHPVVVPTTVTISIHYKAYTKTATLLVVP